jgi:hypothetical protein
MPNIKIPVSVVVFLLAIGAVVVNSQLYRGVGKPVMEVTGFTTHVNEGGRLLRILTTQDNGGARMTFFIAEKTRIFLSASELEEPNPINLEDIRTGDRVTVRYRIRDEQLIATTILIETTTP